MRLKNKNYGGKMSLFENFVYKNGEIVDNSWVKWYHFSVPDEEGAAREKIRRQLRDMGHCMACSSLSGCFFVKSRLPKNRDRVKGCYITTAIVSLLK